MRPVSAGTGRALANRDPSLKPDHPAAARKAFAMSYTRFGSMILISTVVMFGLMYLNTYALEHVFYSQTRTWMALVMGATMAVIMLLFMLSMYRNRTANMAILGASVLVFAGSLWLVRSQQTVGDVAYMKAMIPHHSIAIMTSERARIRDPRVRKLADSIIEAQVREIGEMKKLVAELEANPPASSAPVLQPVR
jgi:magnesium-transporting ATPase (P-type)